MYCWQSGVQVLIPMLNENLCIPETVSRHCDKVGHSEPSNQGLLFQSLHVRQITSFSKLSFPHLLLQHITLCELLMLQKLPVIHPQSLKVAVAISLYGLLLLLTHVRMIPVDQRHTGGGVWPLQNSCHCWLCGYHGTGPLKQTYLVFCWIFSFALLPLLLTTTVLLNHYSNFQHTRNSTNFPLGVNKWIYPSINALADRQFGLKPVSILNFYLLHFCMFACLCLARHWEKTLSACDGAYLSSPEYLFDPVSETPHQEIYLHCCLLHNRWLWLKLTFHISVVCCWNLLHACAWLHIRYINTIRYIKPDDLQTNESHQLSNRAFKNSLQYLWMW